VLLDDVRAAGGRAERLYCTAEDILKAALAESDKRTALQAIRAAVDILGEARGYLELRGKLTGELSKENVKVELAVTVSPALSSLPDEKLRQIQEWLADNERLTINGTAQVIS
jgi:hypothetical protein